MLLTVVARARIISFLALSLRVIVGRTANDSVRGPCHSKPPVAGLCSDRLSQVDLAPSSVWCWQEKHWVWRLGLAAWVQPFQVHCLLRDLRAASSGRVPGSGTLDVERHYGSFCTNKLTLGRHCA